MLMKVVLFSFLVAASTTVMSFLLVLLQGFFNDDPASLSWTVTLFIVSLGVGLLSGAGALLAALIKYKSIFLQSKLRLTSAAGISSLLISFSVELDLQFIEGMHGLPILLVFLGIALAICLLILHFMFRMTRKTPDHKPGSDMAKPERWIK